MWALDSNSQVYLTAIDDFSPESGPAVTLVAHVPDKHHYHGRGGRVFPLWRDAAASVSNVKTALLTHLSTTYCKPVTAPDVIAYVAALLAHPAFTARFKEDLIRPGLRLPVTADAALFDRAVTLGREVIWLHTYGERFADPASGRPSAPPRMGKGQGPTIPVGGTIPGAPNPLPDTMRHDRSTGRLHVGRGSLKSSQPPWPSIRCLAAACCVSGSAIAAPTVPARSSATAVRHQRWTKSSPITGCPSILKTC